jgi:hypothetical protein
MRTRRARRTLDGPPRALPRHGAQGTDPTLTLEGVRVAVTAHRKGAELVAALERRGASVLHAPTIAGDVPVPHEQILADNGHTWLVSEPFLPVILEPRWRRMERRSSSESRQIRTYAPRILKEPARCRFSHLSQAGPPSTALSGRDGSSGVSRVTPASWSRARSISASGTISVMSSIVPPRGGAVNDP